MPPVLVRSSDFVIYCGDFGYVFVVLISIELSRFSIFQMFDIFLLDLITSIPFGVMVGVVSLRSDNTNYVTVMVETELRQFEIEFSHC